MAATRWDIAPHTRAKHDLLRRYLDAWFPILGRYNDRLVFIDGFAGRGVYDDGSPGSPIIAIRTLLEHRSFPRWGNRRFLFVFIEKDRENFESLQDELAKLGSLPANVQVDVRHSTFEDEAKKLAGVFRTQQHNQGPTFAFIDPFGFTGLPISVIRDLMVFPKCEVYINLMADHINRFADDPKRHDAMVELYGTTEFEEVSQAGNRLEALVELYKRQLKTYAGFNYVSGFEMRRADGHVAYFLVHATKDKLGVEKMKAAMWKVDPGGGCRFLDRLAGQEVLFAGDAVDVGLLRKEICSRFAGQTVTPERIHWFTVLETPYGPTHWNKLVLKPLESEGKIAVTRPAGGRKGTFPRGKGVTITFP